MKEKLKNEILMNQEIYQELKRAIVQEMIVERQQVEAEAPAAAVEEDAQVSNDEQ